jgi:pimeloyl-ACP methyl ester carboxylesterase
MSRRRLQKTFERIYGPRTPPSPGEMDAHWALIRENDGQRVLHLLMRYIPERRANRARWVGALKEARIPLRLIDGGADPVSGAHLYRYYREQVPAADAILFEEIGHYPHTEAPDRIAAAFLDFHHAIGTFRS